MAIYQIVLGHRNGRALRVVPYITAALRPFSVHIRQGVCEIPLGRISPDRGASRLSSTTYFPRQKARSQQITIDRRFTPDDGTRLGNRGRHWSLAASQKHVSRVASNHKQPKFNPRSRISTFPISRRGCVLAVNLSKQIPAPEAVRIGKLRKQTTLARRSTRRSRWHLRFLRKADLGREGTADCV